MKKLTFITILIALLAFDSSAQDGHIKYKEYGNSHFFGRTVLQRSDAANLDTLTSVYSGTVAFDTVQNTAKVYNGSEWSSLSIGNIRDTTITIATADVLTLNTTPVEIVPAPGAGYAIQVVAASFGLTFNTTAYATNVTIGIGQASSEPQVELQCLDATVNTIRNINPHSATATTDTQIKENHSLIVSTRTGDPTAGDSDLKVYLTYKIIEL